MKVLVAEDEKKMAALILKGLKAEGCVVDLCHDGNTAAELCFSRPYDAIVLDIMMPGRDGLSLLREIRRRGMSVPVILLTARAGLEERLEGLNMGADDYLPKPFYIEELVARLHAISRRASGRAESILQVSDLTLDLLTRQVRRGERIIELTAREFNLLELLARSPGRVYSRTMIFEQVWDYHFDPGTNLVDVYIKRLRKKVDEPFASKLIETVRGIGYRLRKDEA